MKSLNLLIIFSFFITQSVFGGQDDDIIWYGGELASGEPITLNHVIYNHDDIAGHYHFGFSEMESSIEVLESQKKLKLIHKSGSFTNNGEKWIWKIVKLDDFSVSKGQFKKDKWSGKFVYYFYQPKEYKQHGIKIFPIIKLKGLIIYNSPVDLGNEFEYSIKSYNKPKVAGDYSESHYRLYSSKDVENKSKFELKLMRNEIFARYGYIFISGGKMQKLGT